MNNHANIARYTNRPQVKQGDLKSDGSWISPGIAFQRAEQMNEMLLREANQRIKPEDMVICVGDFSCRGGERGVKGVHLTPAELLKSLNGTWTIVAGNHDDQNGVKVACKFLACDIGKYRVGVQHRPLQDETFFRRWQSGTEAEKAMNPWRDKLSNWHRTLEFQHAEYCRRMFDFMIVGHVHNAWHVKKIAGLWHVNVGVDVNRYMPINDTEVILLFEKAVRGESNG